MRKHNLNRIMISKRKEPPWTGWTAKSGEACGEGGPVGVRLRQLEPRTSNVLGNWARLSRGAGALLKG